jgi:uncharacterized protein YjiS (DUF1127 family)
VRRLELPIPALSRIGVAGSVTEVRMTRSPASLAPAPQSVSHGRTSLGFFRLIATVLATVRHRREVMNLADLDDRALKDIGLERTDVDQALSEPLFRNPSLVLVRSVAEQRRGRQSIGERPVVPVKSPR